jgi:hypothetical protein
LAPYELVHVLSLLTLVTLVLGFSTVVDDLLELVQLVLPQLTGRRMELPHHAVGVPVDELEALDLSSIVLFDQPLQLLFGVLALEQRLGLLLLECAVNVFVGDSLDDVLIFVDEGRLVVEDWEVVEHDQVGTLLLLEVEGLVLVALLQQNVVVDGQVRQQLVQVLERRLRLQYCLLV